MYNTARTLDSRYTRRKAEALVTVCQTVCCQKALCSVGQSYDTKQSLCCAFVEVIDTFTRRQLFSGLTRLSSGTAVSFRKL